MDGIVTLVTRQFASPGRSCSLAVVNIGVRASYWRFIKAPGGADNAQR